MLNSPAAAANMYPWYRGGAASAGDPAAAAAAASAMSQLGQFCGAANIKTENGYGGGGGGGGSLGASVGGGGGSHAAAAAAAADCGMLALDYAAHNKVGKLNEHQILCLSHKFSVGINSGDRMSPARFKSPSFRPLLLLHILNP